MIDITALSAEFPKEAIHWRAQTLTKAGDKALALAYIDARDVMDRLDQVCGPSGWTDSYVESAKGRVICTISIKCGDEWIAKSDGAGDTNVEGEKGGISDAFKRAAVKWGIGRYLYRMDSVWAPCESYDKNDRKVWKAWKGSPWDAVRNRPANDPAPNTINDAQQSELQVLIEQSGIGSAKFLSSFGIEKLSDLPEKKFAPAGKRLREIIHENTTKKEAA